VPRHPSFLLIFSTSPLSLAGEEGVRNREREREREREKEGERVVGVLNL
jgi:hypothetical protein